nr:sigma-70 family RNA polymerase sigma factor [Cytophagales bacterium]
MYAPNGNPTYNEGDILAWWNLLRSGDKKGLAMIYAAYVDDMYRVGMSIKSNSSYVQDCIHEVFVSLWHYREGLKDTDNVKLYLFRCLSNKIHREFAQASATLHLHPVNHFDGMFSVDSYEFDLIREQGNDEIKRKLKIAFEKLPLRQKEVVQHLFFENLSYEDTSTVMNLHLKSVYNLVCKAICNLRKGLVSIGYLLSFPFFDYFVR